jgi:hypothetical protein
VKPVNTQSAEKTYGRPARYDKMEAIASGVRARLEESTGYSRRLTDETVNTARALGVSDAVIERWTAERLNRLAQETIRLREIRAILYRARWDSSSATLA